MAASRIRVPSAWHGLDVAERVRLIGRATHDWACEKGVDMDAMIDALELEFAGELEKARALRRSGGVEQVVYERPQVYRVGRSKGDPNDLLPLFGVGAAIAARLDVEAVSYTPASWIGRIKKSETGDPLKSPRGRIVWGCLTEQERDRVTLSHDALDAAGLGLRHLDRLGTRLYPDLAIA